MSAFASNCPQNDIPKAPAIKKDQGCGKAWINEIYTYVHIHTYLCTHTGLASGLLIVERERNLAEQAQTVERTKCQNQVSDIKPGQTAAKSSKKWDICDLLRGQTHSDTWWNKLNSQWYQMAILTTRYNNTKPVVPPGYCWKKPSTYKWQIAQVELLSKRSIWEWK